MPARVLAVLAFALVMLCGWHATVAGVTFPVIPVVMGAVLAVAYAVIGTGITMALRGAG
jgi:uncharacterized RDD family membrane protein YckC